MKEGYIPKDQRKKILLITDDIRLPSGVGGVGKDIIINTLIIGAYEANANYEGSYKSLYFGCGTADL